MFTSDKIKDGDGYLDKHLVANDYYNENESVSGEWLGKGAQRLEIEGRRIDAGDRAFAALRRNRAPDGRKLTPRDRDDRVRFISFQCSAPKSVSILGVTIGDARLVEAHREAVAVGFAEMEKFAACQANSRTERRNRFTGNLTAARFTHTSSRALDPQIHDHLVLVTATYDEASGDWRALTEYEIFKAVRYLGKVYQNELARRCRELGYETRAAYDERRRVIGFEIAGVSDETLRLFSKRRAQVERAIAHFTAKHGREPTRAETQVMVNQTRDSKLAETSTAEVIGWQRAQLAPETLQALDDEKWRAMRCPKEPRAPEFPGAERQAMREAVAHLDERHCVSGGHAILAEALNRNLGALDLARLRRQLDGPGLVAVGDGADDGLHETFATPDAVWRERRILTAAATDRGALPPLAEGFAVAEKLSDEQRRAVSALLAGTDRVALLRGAAGVGKTTVLAEIDRILRDHARPVAYCAPTASAADTLRRDGLAGATTLAAFLENARRAPPPRGGVLVLDEAGLASHRDGEAILLVALAHDQRVVLVGDTRQHNAVESGDFMRLIEERGRTHRVELSEIRRQTEKDYKEAVRLMAAGDAKSGLERLDGMGCVRAGGPEYLQNAALDYAAARRESPEKSLLCVTPTWAENHTLTEAIRRELRKAGELGGGAAVSVQEPLGWTGREKRDAARYAPGMEVVFDRREGSFAKGESAVVTRVAGDAVYVRASAGTERRLPLARGGFEVCAVRDIELAPGDMIQLRANDRSHGLMNGALLRVESVSAEQIRTKEGPIIDPHAYRRFAHGYVVTSHKSQGKTCDRVIVAAAKLDAKAAYVACSRGRSACVIHTPDKPALLASLPAGHRPLVAEQGGFACAELADAGVGSSEAGHREMNVAKAWFDGPWNRFTTWVRGLGRDASVDAMRKGETQHENHPPQPPL